MRYTKKWLLLIVLVYYYLTPSTVNGNKQMYGRTRTVVASIQCKSVEVFQVSVLTQSDP